jgi:hypothetical protein
MFDRVFERNQRHSCGIKWIHILTKVIDVSDEAEPLPKWHEFSSPEPEIDPDKPIFDRGEGAWREPMSLAQLEAAVIPAFQAQQKKVKLAPVVVYTPEMHRRMDSQYYSGRPRSTGSETRRRSVNSLGRLVGDHGAHRIQGAYGKLKDDTPDAPVPTFQPAPEVALGYCHECNKAIPRSGPNRRRADAKFCSEAHSKAFRRREEQRQEFNRAFKDYWETVAGKAEAILQADARHAAVIEMQESAARAGIEGAEFFATPTGIIARAASPLPPIRIMALSKSAPDRHGPMMVEQPIEVQTSDVPDLGATLYTFSFPMQQPGAIGAARSLSVGFLGDPGTGFNDGYPTQEQQETIDGERAKNAAENAKWMREWRAGAARRERARAERIARGGPGSTSARQAHAEERMKNLLARPDHNQIIKEFEEAKDWDGLREFYAAKRQAIEGLNSRRPTLQLKKARVRDNLALVQ